MITEPPAAPSPAATLPPACVTLSALPCECYLDIETDWAGAITVVGIYVPPPGPGLMQLVGPEVTAKAVAAAVPAGATVFSFNGHAFDLPMIQRCLGLDLRGSRPTVDLCTLARRQGLSGGLKEVERRVGIARGAPAGLTGKDAPRLWDLACRGDDEAFRLLLAYNGEDVINLHRLRQILMDREGPWLLEP